MLYLLSLGLGLPPDTCVTAHELLPLVLVIFFYRLWNLHHQGNYDDDGALRGPSDESVPWKHSQDHFRFQLYRRL